MKLNNDFVRTSYDWLRKGFKLMVAKGVPFYETSISKPGLLLNLPQMLVNKSALASSS